MKSKTSTAAVCISFATAESASSLGLMAHPTNNDQALEVHSMFDEISHCYGTDKAYWRIRPRQFRNVVSGVYTPLLAKDSKMDEPEVRFWEICR
jgi:hypothetical protein